MLAILLQSVTIIILYERSASETNTHASGGTGANATYTIEVEPPQVKATPGPAANTNGRGPNGMESPGGLILGAAFGYMQDPRETNRKNPRPHVLPTFENIYHFVSLSSLKLSIFDCKFSHPFAHEMKHTTVLHHQLHAIIFHDDFTFNSSFVDEHTVDPYVKFIRVQHPTFDNGEPVISPNDFRFQVFDKFIKENAVTNAEDQSVSVFGVKYGWFMISDLDMFFQRNPFPVIQKYADRGNYTFIGSFDGGMWEHENMRLQRRLFRNCYGRKMLLGWTDLEWKTENGNCGLWAAKFDSLSCILRCMSGQYDKPPVQGKGSKTICDMAVHDYCVMYGGCWEGGEVGVYDRTRNGALWGEKTMGAGNDLFGPPYGRYRQCQKDSWSVVHNRCDFVGPLCFKEENGTLVKYHQTQLKGKLCKLDENHQPVANTEYTLAGNTIRKDLT